MKSQVFTEFTLTMLPATGLFLFLLLFIAALVWVFRKDSNKFYEQLEQIPFNEDQIRDQQ
ncbi:CcoQ/FixQ family Cbb3-type cytochrome c oxidase assembly chaperone [Bacteriovoracaceae bacterium]|nr:CcoQ/FixQ family Cbb3-type cytochrome c oxidase assembly chaperone [Bacteriovoracaceae bacterium]